MGRLDTIYNKKNIPSYITPLFWQHGEEEKILREEIKQMNENGIGGFIVESRPHPDFLGGKWWKDIDIIIDEAKKRNMKVWLFDDILFPSGFCGGKIRDNHPEYLKVYLDERHIDAVGPLKGSSFIIKAWMNNEEKIVVVIAARRIDGIDSIDAESLTDITDLISEGILYWDVPEGDWRIFILIMTRNGGEEATRDYLNPIEPLPVKAFIDYVYEEYYKHYSNEFGKTIAGFFSDEPRFGNSPTYEGTLGNFNMAAPYSESGCINKMVLPYSDTLLSYLDNVWKGDYKRYLPCLWYDAGPITANVRYVFMDVISTLFGENYTKQIGDWCRQHGVKYIGHVAEDNGTHARLGFGAGHYFRAINGQDYSGLDIVYQVWPEFSKGKFFTPFGYLDAEFFYWGITKMASSAGHIDPKKNGTTVCEIFGAYGWQEGLKLMKWLTDHVCVRGVNFLIPHAFSPIYPDPDCPPHFYARGANPQWRYFNIWSSYANRVCHMLSGGRHVAPIAVIYHAEAEWAGKYMSFEKVVKAIALEQIDCDVIPIDLILDREAVRVKEGSFTINNEEYRAIIIPYSQRLPEEFVEKLLVYTDNQVPVIFVDNYPEDSSISSTSFINIVARLKENTFSKVIPLETLAEDIKNLGLYDIETISREEYLRYYHYINESESIFFFTNESKYRALHTSVRINEDGIPVVYDAMKDQLYSIGYSSENGCTQLKLYLEPYESIFIIFNASDENTVNIAGEWKSDGNPVNKLELKGQWRVSASEPEKYPQFQSEEKIIGLGNVAVPGKLPEFSGTLRYETEFFYKSDYSVKKVFLDLGDVYETAEVWVNNYPAGVRICPPYCVEITDFINDGQNEIRLDITNTLSKKHGCNVFDRAMAQEPSGLIGPVKLIFLHS